MIPRTGSAVRWFEAASTYVLHWVNAYEEGDEIVLDGFFQEDPEPKDIGDGSYYQRMFRFLAPRPDEDRNCTAGASTSKTGGCREERLTDSVTEFGVLNSGHGGVGYRYAYAATGVEALVPVRRPDQTRPADRQRGDVQPSRERLRQRARHGPPHRRHRARTTATSSR